MTTETSTEITTETVSTVYRCRHDGKATLAWSDPFDRRDQLMQARAEAERALCPRCQQAQQVRQQAASRGGQAIQARYRGTCRDCDGSIHVGDLIVWSRDLGARHLNCGDIRQPSAISEY